MFSLSRNRQGEIGCKDHSRDSQWRGFFPVECATLFFLTLVISLYVLLGLPFRSPFNLYFQKISGAFVWYFTGLLLCLLILRLRDLQRAKRGIISGAWAETFGRYQGLYLTPRVLFRDLRLLNALALVFVIFIQLKHLIPWVNPSLYDPIFALSDRMVCGGYYCGELIVDYFGREASGFFSETYLAFFPYLGFLLMTMVLQRDAVLSQTFCLAFSLVWFLGILLVYLLPTLGPCYWEPESFSDLLPSTVGEMREELRQVSNFVLANPKSASGAYMISGFPSLHLAAPTLGTVALWRVSRLLGVLSLVFTLLTFCSTLYFGWHYLLDDLGGIALALLIAYLTLGSSGNRCRESVADV